MKPNTLRFKISVVYVALIGAILILLQGILYFNYAHSVSNEFDTHLLFKADQIGGAVNTFKNIFGPQPQALELATQKALDFNIEYPEYLFMPESPQKSWLADAKRLGLDHDYIVIMDMQGNVITSSNNVPSSLLTFLQKIKKPYSYNNTYYKFKSGKNVLRLITMPFFYAYQQGYTIAVASSYYPVEVILWRHALFIAASTLIFLILASLIVRVFVIRVLSSVMEISNVARNITQENLKSRIKLTHSDDEIKHLTGSLNEMISRLEKSFTHVKEFSMEMAHEVKTPLAIISAQSKMAVEGHYTPDEYKDIFRTVLKEAKRTQIFVSDLLLLTKLDYRLIKMRFDDLDLSDLLREICVKMQMIASQKEITIQQNISLEPMVLKGDKIHLGRVFINLIDNALKFTPPGGQVYVGAQPSGREGMVLISDTGLGIAPQDLSKIFNKFYHGEHGTDTPGSGFGLSIARSIIQIHHGHISTESELGKGTSFKIGFPLVSVPVAEFSC